MTPSPPTLMATRMTTWPKPDQYVAVSTVTSPVTQTADTAVNSASTNGARWPLAVATGSESRPVTRTMTLAKTVIASRAGELRPTSSTRARVRANAPAPAGTKDRRGALVCAISTSPSVRASPAGRGRRPRCS